MEYCPICLCSFTNAYVTDCGHEFCAHCLFSLIRKTRSCPSCRSKVKLCTPQEDINDCIALSYSGVTFHASAMLLKDIIALFGISNQHRCKLIHKGKVLEPEEHLGELARRRTTVLLLLSTPTTTPHRPWSVLETAASRLSHFMLLLFALLIELLGPILPPIQLFFTSLFTINVNKPQKMKQHQSTAGAISPTSQDLEERRRQ